MVAWNFTPDHPTSRRSRAIAKFICHYEGTLPDTYGVKAHELADLMESLRLKYASPANA